MTDIKDAANQGEATLLEATAFGVIPVVEADGVAEADGLAEALLEAGPGVIEVTFRTHAAAEVIARIVQRYPDMVVGAGMVVGAQDLPAGAGGGDRPSLRAGAMMPSELQAGMEHGIRTFKFFPAMLAGGIPFLRSIAAAFGLHEPAVAAVGGTWIASRSMIRDGDWAGIRRKAQEAIHIARAVREPA